MEEVSVRQQPTFKKSWFANRKDYLPAERLSLKLSTTQRSLDRARAGKLHQQAGPVHVGCFLLPKVRRKTHVPQSGKQAVSYMNRAKGLQGNSGGKREAGMEGPWLGPETPTTQSQGQKAPGQRGRRTASF